MRNALYATAGSALALALLAYSLPASADVTVLANITKTKDTTVTEQITINKTVDIQVGTPTVVTDTTGATSVVILPVNFEYKSAAEADAIVNQRATNNHVDRSQIQLSLPTGITTGQLNDFGIHLDATMTDSGNSNTGIVNINQDVGNMSNQGNQLSLAVSTPAVPHTTTENPVDETARVLTNSQSEAQQINQGNSVRHLEVAATTDYRGGLNENSSIDGSLNGNVGVLNVNQNSGNMNNQANSEALAVAIDLAGVALSEAALGQVNGASGSPEGGPNSVFEAGVDRHASMTGSLNGNVGIGGVNQASGNMANQANIFSTAFIDGGGGVGLSGAHAAAGLQ